MAPIPKPQPSTVRAIYDSYEQMREEFDSFGISVGEIGDECDRALFYSFRWASERDKPNGQSIRLFRRGDIEEVRLIEDLKAIGATVSNTQGKIRLAGGHLRGRMDGEVLGIPEAPKTPHLLELKSMNAKNFALLQKSGCEQAQPKHYAQLQLGMHSLGYERGLYLVTNKDNEELYAERIKYDMTYCLRQVARAERITALHQPPARISEDPEFFKCRFCAHRAVCHSNKFPRLSCRSCLHSTAHADGGAHWSCDRHTKPLTFDEQKEGCPNHLFLPGMVPGAQIDVDGEQETVTYKLANGATYVDGAEERPL